MLNIYLTVKILLMLLYDMNVTSLAWIGIDSRCL